jgi:hypothetical protein
MFGSSVERGPMLFRQRDVAQRAEIYRRAFETAARWSAILFTGIRYEILLRRILISSGPLGEEACPTPIADGGGWR